MDQIRYHAPVDSQDIARWQTGKLPDPANQLDTPGTVQAIRSQNAAIAAVCSGK